MVPSQPPPAATAFAPATSGVEATATTHTRWVDSPDCASIQKIPLAVGKLEIRDGVRRLSALVEVASNPNDRGRGLMCRAEMPAGTGMAFVWGEPSRAGFWMYNTYVPLDLLYVDAEGRVVAMRTMTPCPRRPGEADRPWTARCGEESRGYGAGDEYLMAIELPAGWLAEQGFQAAASQGWRIVLASQ